MYLNLDFCDAHLVSPCHQDNSNVLLGTLTWVTLHDPCIYIWILVMIILSHYQDNRETWWYSNVLLGSLTRITFATRSCCRKGTKAFVSKSGEERGHHVVKTQDIVLLFSSSFFFFFLEIHVLGGGQSERYSLLKIIVRALMSAQMHRQAGGPRQGNGNGEAFDEQVCWLRL